MKKINFKQNKIFYICGLAIIILFIAMAHDYLVRMEGARNIVKNQKNHDFCVKYVNADEENKLKLIDEFEDEMDYTPYTEDCEVISQYHSSPSAIMLFNNLTVGNNVGFNYLVFYAPLFLLFPFVYILSKEFKSSFVKNYVLRDNYKNYIKRILKKAYSNIWIIPFLLCVVFVISYIVTGHVDVRSDVYNNYIKFPEDLPYNPFFYIGYILVLLFNFGFYINLALILLFKNRNFVVVLIESYLLIFFIWVLDEVMFVNNLSSIFNVDYRHFTMLNFYNWDGVTNILVYVLYNFVIFLISFILVILIYKNKEKFIQNCEK